MSSNPLPSLRRSPASLLTWPSVSPCSNLAAVFCVHWSVNSSTQFPPLRTGYKKPLSLFEVLISAFLLYHGVSETRMAEQDVILRPLWTVLGCPWRWGGVGWGGALFRGLPVFPIDPVASPCQQTDPSCRFLPVISKCFKEHSHLLLGIC